MESTDSKGNHFKSSQHWIPEFGFKTVRAANLGRQDRTTFIAFPTLQVVHEFRTSQPEFKLVDERCFPVETESVYRFSIINCRSLARIKCQTWTIRLA